MSSRRHSTSVGRETYRLLERIRELVRQTDRGHGANGAAVRAQKRQIEQLKTQLAEIVKRNPTGLEDGPAGGERNGVRR